MYVLGSEMHVLTFVFLILELIFFTFQLWYYYVSPQDKARFYYLILLGLLINYNLTGGLFPDPVFNWISTRSQNIIAYGSGFLMAAFFPFYFYKVFELRTLRFQAFYGVSFCLLLPYFIFFGIFYGTTGNLENAVKYGMIIPFFYSLYLYGAITSAINKKFIADSILGNPHNLIEIRGVYLAVSPWVCMTVFSFFKVTQWIEVLFTNTGFVVLTGLFMLRSSRQERKDRERLIVLEAEGKKQGLDFERSCAAYGLTTRERQVAKLLCRGLTYRDIADSLFISVRTVDVHVRNIFSKTEVNKKMDLQQQLGFAN